MKNYYTLVAGMPDLSPDDAKPACTVEEFKKEYWPQLSVADRKIVSLFFLKYDHRNLLARLSGTEEEQPFDSRALYTPEDWDEAIRQVKDDDRQSHRLPPYFYDFIASYPELKEVQEHLPEDVLTAGYYRYALTFKNRFIADWFSFNRNVNNILIALTGRKYGFSPAPYIVGDDAVSVALSVSGARDFGLGSELDYIDDVVRIHEMADPVEKERKLDRLKWDWLDEHTFFCYFTVERLFAFLVRLDIIERWTLIDKEKGSKMFRGLIDRLKNEVEIPQESMK